MNKKTVYALLLLVWSFSHVNASTIEMIRRVNRETYNLPEILALGVPKVESSFNPKARGAVGERGLYQLKVATARGIGCHGDLYHAETNTRCGLKHLSIAYNKCGTIAGAANLHNAGLGASCAPSAYSYKVIRAGSQMVIKGYEPSYRGNKSSYITPEKPRVTSRRDEAMEFLMNKSKGET